MPQVPFNMDGEFVKQGRRDTLMPQAKKVDPPVVRDRSKLYLAAILLACGAGLYMLWAQQFA